MRPIGFRQGGIDAANEFKPGAYEYKARVGVSMVRLLLAIGLGLALTLLTGCATDYQHAVTYGAPLTRSETIRRHMAPPIFGCTPSYTNPDGIPNGGCI